MMNLREEFEKRHGMPTDVSYNEERDTYCWTGYTVACPEINDAYEAFCEGFELGKKNPYSNKNEAKVLIEELEEYLRDESCKHCRGYGMLSIGPSTQICWYCCGTGIKDEESKP